MKICLQALLLMIVPFAYSMESSLSLMTSLASSSSSTDKKQSDTRIIVKNNTPFNLWFSINAGGSFTEKSNDGHYIGYQRIAQGTSIFCDEIEAGGLAGTSKFADGLFITAKAAQGKDSLKNSQAVLFAKIFDPKKFKNVVMISLEYDQNAGYSFFLVRKNELCYICKNSFQRDNEICLLGSCGHSFHIACYNPVQKKRAYVYADAQEKYVKSQYCPFCEQLIDVDTIVEKTID